MIDRIFSAALTFCLLVAGTLAIASAMLERTPAVVTLPQVIVIGKRAPADAPLAVAQAAQASLQQTP